MNAIDKKFNTLVKDETLYMQESDRVIKWIIQYNDTLNFFRLHILHLSTNEINQLSKKCGHLKAMIEKYSKYINSSEGGY